MNNLNGFRIWDKKENKMYYSNVSKNEFLIDCCGNLFRTIKYEGDPHLDNRSIRLIPCHEAVERYVVMLNLDRTDMAHRGVCEGDILRYETGNEFVVAFGTHPSFCHGDRMDTTNEGFCALLYEDGKAIANSFNAYPLSDLESLALVVGNMYEGYYQEGE